MGVLSIIRNFVNIQPTSGQNILVDGADMPNGGILLDAYCQNIPNDFYNEGTDAEEAKRGDLLVRFLDSSTLANVLNLSGSPLEVINVAVEDQWSWGHPDRNFLFNIERVISKLGYRAGITSDIIGAIQGQLSIQVNMAEPPGIQHNLLVQATILTFD